MNIRYNPKYRLYGARSKTSDVYALAATAQQAALMLRRGRKLRFPKGPRQRATFKLIGG